VLLVDTSIWVLLFRAREPFDIENQVDLGEVVTCLPVIQEVLQGFREEHAYRVARSAMFAFPIVDSPLPAERFEEAANLFRGARRAGVTVRSSVDCLIAATAIAHNLEVLHADRDFDQLSRVSSLRVREVR
jgi:predicted nucleic acid-binding protein